MWPWSKLAELEDRIAKLEARPIDPKMLTDFGVRHCLGYGFGYGFSDSFLDGYRVTHSEAIRAILRHLDLELVKTGAISPVVKVEKKAPPPSLADLFAPTPATKKRK